MAGLYDGLQEASGTIGAPSPAPNAPKSIYDGLEMAPTVAEGALPTAPREASGALESLKAGLQGSAPGLAWRGKLPDLVVNPEHASWWERALSGIAHVGAELPLMIGGAIAGAPAGAAIGTAVAPGAGTAVGSLLGAGAGMGAVPAAIRQTLIEAYKAGDVMTAADFWNSLREVAKTTAMEAGINAAAMGAGAVAGRVVGKAIAPSIGQTISVPTAMRSIEAADLAAQIAAMPTIPAAFQGRLPDAQEFMDAAILIGGLKAAHVTAKNITSVFIRTGKTPAEQVQDVQNGLVKPEEFVGPPEPAQDVGYLTQLLRNRLNALDAKAEGTPDQTMPGPDGKPMVIPGTPKQFMSPEEQQERKWISENIDNPDAIAARYRLTRPQQTGQEYSADQYVPPSRMEMLRIQENLFTETARLNELEAKAQAAPLTDAERLDFNAMKARVLDLENQIKTKAPDLARTPTYTADQFLEARRMADERSLELTTKVDAGEQLTDAERAERVFLNNSANKPDALARHFDLEPQILVRPSAEQMDASAQKIHDDVLRQVRDADEARKAAGLEPLGDDHAQAVAALVRARMRTRAERLGMLPEDLYRERPVQIQDETSALKPSPDAIEEPAKAPDVQTSTEATQEVDLFGDPIREAPAPRMEVQNLATQEVPLANLILSKEVPQFKMAANKEGVVQPLGGRFDRTGVGPVQVWERLDGTLEVISGRHRLDLARRSGEETIPAQIHKEADGFDARQAATLDAQLNIREEQGSVADYAQYFKDAGIDKATAEERGLLARAKGRTGFTIARDASPDLLASHRAGRLTDEAALVISSTAPGSARLQALGIAAVNDGKSHLYASNLMRSVDMMAAERMMAGEQGDIFGFDDSALREASAMAKKASSKQRAISEQIAAVSGASKRPELARKMGVNVEDPAAVQAKIIELKQEQYLWDNWPLYPELVAKLRGETLKQDAVPDQASESHDAWAQNYSDVVGDDLKKASTRDIDRAIAYAASVIGNLNKHAQRGEPFNADLLRSIKVEHDAMRAEWLTRPDRFTYANDAEFPLKPETPAEAAARDQEAAAEAMREGAMKGQPLFQKRDQQHRGSYDIAENLVTIMQGADKSTVVHELWHSWLEEMKADANRPDAPEQIKADWEILRKELAIGKDGEISRASHEQLARSGERYLAEGEAPSPELRGVFARFREWLLAIYKDLRNLNVTINPELKDVLDRMLATDEEIAQAKELGVPKEYAPIAAEVQATKIVPPPAPARRTIDPGFAAEQASMRPYADELPPGPGEAPDNIHVNYAYINSPMDVKLAMQRMAEIDQANIQRQRGGTEGVKSWAEANAEQAKYLNDILGGSEDTLHLFEPRDPEAPHVDVRLGILKKLAVGAAKDSARLRDVVLEAGHDATVRQQLEYMGSIERARMIQAEFLGERASVARALNALKDVTEGTGEIGRMLEAIGLGDNTMFQTARTPAEEQAYLRAKLDEIMQSYKGKSVLDIAKLHKEIGTLKGTFKFTEDVTKATKWEMVVEGWRAGLLSGPVTHTTNLFGTEAFHFMRPAVDALASIIGMARGASPGMGESDRASMSEAVARITGMLGAVQDGFKVGVATFRLDDPTGKTEAYRTAIPGRAGEIIRIPLRMMGAEDAMVTTMYERGELRTLAIRQAFDEQMNPSTREFADRVQSLIDNPTEAMKVAAEAAATRMTFNMPLGEKGVALQSFVNKWNLQWVVPFIRTPINIAKELLRMSPFAPAIGEWRAAIRKGGVERDRALAEMALGSGIMALTAAYAFAGNISGNGSPDPGKNRGKTGVWQPYSILINGTWYEYSRIQPTGTLMGMAADMAAVWDHMSDEEKNIVPKMLATAFAQAITNQTFLQGITNVVNAMSDPARFAPRFLQQMAGSMVPNIIGQPTTMADPVTREVNSMLEAIQARIPGMRQDLIPRRDWLGEPAQTRQRVGVILPSRTLDVSTDKVRLEAARLDLSMAGPPKITHLGKGTGKIGNVDFTPEEVDKFEQISGQFIHPILDNIVNAPGYDAMPDVIKQRIFRQVITAGRRVAAVQALPVDKRMAYLQSITEKITAELQPGETP